MISYLLLRNNLFDGEYLCDSSKNKRYYDSLLDDIPVCHVYVLSK